MGGLMLHKKRVYTFFVILFAFFGSKSYAQNQPHDSVLLKRYQDLCNTYVLHNADSLFKYASIQLIIAKKINSVPHQIYAYTNLGVAYTRIFKFDDALSCYLTARKIIEKNNRAGGSTLLGQIGYIYLRLNRNIDAYKYFKLQETESLKEKNYKSYLSCIVNLSDYYNTLGEIDSTIAILHKGLIIARKHKFHDNEVIIIDNLANAYYSKALEKNDKTLFKKVEQYADTALKHHYADKDSSAIFYVYGLLGALNMNTGNYVKSEEYYNQYIDYSKRTQDIINLKIGIDECSELYAVQGKYNKAYAYRLMYDSINKLYVNEEANKQVEELNTKYETEKKEEQNLLLKKQNDLSSKTIKQQKVISYFIIASLVLSLLFGVFMFNVYSQKKKAHLLITKQKEQVEQKQIEIEHQKLVIEEKQKEIVDSINYARRIQYALLAHDELLNRNLSEHFVLFKPKDIVSGDFYWAAEHNDKFYLAVCDSTGHGVPGAFMSLLNIGFLSEAIKEKKILQPNEIFNYVRQRLIESISNGDQKDGMDGILIQIDKITGRITYAAANCAPLVVRNNEMIIHSKDNMPIGKGERKNDFSLFNLELQKGDSLFLYTDGFADQFGGQKGKKFKYKQLNELLVSVSNQGSQNQEIALAKQFDDWKGNLEQVDDVLIIGIKV